MPVSTSFPDYRYTFSGGADDFVDFSAPPPPGAVHNSGAGDDTIIGSAGRDFLNRGLGSDFIVGGLGNDVLNDGAMAGRPEQNVLIGGDYEAYLNSQTIQGALDALSGGNDTYILHASALNLILGFDGLGGRTAGPQDFLRLDGFVAGSTLHLFEERIEASDGPDDTAIYTNIQSYEVLSPDDTIQGLLVLFVLGATEAEVTRHLSAGDYAFA